MKTMFGNVAQVGPRSAKTFEDLKSGFQFRVVGDGKVEAEIVDRFGSSALLQSFDDPRLKAFATRQLGIAAEGLNEGETRKALQSDLHELLGEQGDAQALALDDQRRVGMRKVAAAAEVGDAGTVEPTEHLAEGGRAVIAGMVVGQAKGVEMTLEQCQHARMGAEGVGFVRLGFAVRGDDAFEIADTDVGGIEPCGKGHEGIAAAPDLRADRLGEHDVADEGDGNDGFRRFAARQAGHRAEHDAEQWARQLHRATSRSVQR